MNLHEAKVNKKYKVISVETGYKTIQRLANLGIYSGVIINKEESFRRGPCIVTKEGSRYSFGYGITSKIIVEEVE